MKRLLTFTLVAVLAAGCGSAAPGTGTTRTVTHTDTVYKTRTVYRAPEACLAALDDYHTVATLSNDANIKLIDALQYGDVDSINGATGKIRRATAIINGRLIGEAAACYTAGS